LLRVQQHKKSPQMLGPKRRAAAEIAAICPWGSEKFDSNSQAADLVAI
jgi:hypothetical protein